MRDRPRADRPGPANDEIIAIGAVPIEDGRLILGESRYTLVRTARRSEHDAVLVHKLRVADLADAPPLDEALELLLELLSGRVPVFHTAAVERTFLAPLFAQLPGAAARPRPTPRCSAALACCAATGRRPPRLSLARAARAARSAGRAAAPRARRRAARRRCSSRSPAPRRGAAADGRLAVASRQLAGQRAPLRRCLENS